MYTWEIGETLKRYNYNIPSSVYLDICRSSPQIIYITDNGGTRYKIVCKEKKDDENYEYPEWEFSVNYDGN